MLSYRDTTYCKDFDSCLTTDCSRRLTPQDHVRLDTTCRDMPVAWMSFKEGCTEYRCSKSVAKRLEAQTK